FGLTQNTWLSATETGSQVGSNFTGEDAAFSLEGKSATIDAPTELTVSINDTGNAVLNWTDNSGGETGFIVERATSEDGPFDLLATLAIDTETYTDPEVLEANTTYYYEVRATSEIVNSAAAAQSILTLPAAPEGLEFTLRSGGALAISWTVNDGIQDYAIDLSNDDFGSFYKDVNDSIVSNNSFSIEVDEVGTYKVRLRALNDAGASESATLDILVESVLSTAELISFEIYPNPAQNDISIQFSGDVFNENMNIRLTSVSGKTVLKTTQLGNGEASINISDLTSGVYVLDLQVGDNRYQRKFIKK
ncbi:MAG: T9SS type A sorting domain-containing protein, partial [Bacteroidota bacterium]